MKGTDFAVPPGEAFGLLGPNGAGKSTTVGMLTTTIAPSSGRAYVAGFDVAADPIAARRASAMVFQESVLDRALTGRRNLAVHARLWGLAPTHANTRIPSVVAAFGLADLIDRPVNTSSVEQVQTWLDRIHKSVRSPATTTRPTSVTCPPTATRPTCGAELEPDQPQSVAGLEPTTKEI